MLLASAGAGTSILKRHPVVEDGASSCLRLRRSGREGLHALAAPVEGMVGGLGVGG